MFKGFRDSYFLGLNILMLVLSLRIERLSSSSLGFIFDEKLLFLLPTLISLIVVIRVDSVFDLTINSVC